MLRVSVVLWQLVSPCGACKETECDFDDLGLDRAMSVDVPSHEISLCCIRPTTVVIGRDVECVVGKLIIWSREKEDDRL